MLNTCNGPFDGMLVESSVYQCLFSEYLLMQLGGERQRRQTGHEQRPSVLQSSKKRMLIAASTDIQIRLKMFAHC